MATRIKLKRGTGTPADDVLQEHEVAMDAGNGNIYVGVDNAGTIEANILANKYDDADAVNAIESNASTLDMTNGLNVGGVLTTNDITAPSTTSTNQTDAAIKIETNWVYGGAADVSAYTYNFPVNFSAFDSRFLLNSWATENGYNYARLSCIDTGTGDDGTHDAELLLHGEHNYIQSSPIANRTDLNDLTVKSNDFNVASNNNIDLDAPNQINILTSKGIDFSNPSLTLEGTYHQTNVVTDTGTTGLWKLSSTGDDGNGDYLQFFQGSFLGGDSQFRVSTSEVMLGYGTANKVVAELSNGNFFELEQIPKIQIKKDYDVTGADVFQYIRKNNEDTVTPANDSLIADGTEVKFNFLIQSADGSTEQLIGGITGRTHSTDGNELVFTMDNQAQDDTVNFTIAEDRIAPSMPLAFPQFTTTERDAMSPSDGWVLYNTTTNKLQVYSSGSWVDLH